MLLSGQRGAKNISDTFRMVFRISFSLYFSVSSRIHFYRGQFRSADVPPCQVVLLFARFGCCQRTSARKTPTQGAAKGGRQKEFDHFSVSFWSLFLMHLSLFSQTPFAGLLLRQGDEIFMSTVGNPCPTFGQLLTSRILHALLVGEKQYEIAQAKFCTCHRVLRTPWPATIRKS